MLNAMQEFFPAHVEYTRPEGGMFIWATMKDGTPALDLSIKQWNKRLPLCPVTHSIHQNECEYNAPKLYKCYT